MLLRVPAGLLWGMEIIVAMESSESGHSPNFKNKIKIGEINFIKYNICIGRCTNVVVCTIAITVIFGRTTVL